MSEYRAYSSAGEHPAGDTRPILLRPCRTDEIRNDKADILDLVRKRIEERGIKPITIRKKGVSNWGPDDQYRLTQRMDEAFWIERAYQLAVAVRLKRTKALPFSL